MIRLNVVIAILILLVKVNIYSKPEQQKYFKLEDECFKFLDGVHNCFDKSAIWEMQYLRLLTRNLREKGILNYKTKECLMFNNKECSITDLVLLEEQNNFDNHLQLKDNLKKAKNAYLKFTYNIRKRMSKVKKFFGQIIKESCEKRNIKPEQTMLHDWSEIKQNEESFFYEKIKNFKELDKFLIQFYNFLGDLVYSCPKGYAQFKKEYQRIKEQINGKPRRDKRDC